MLDDEEGDIIKVNKILLICEETDVHNGSKDGNAEFNWRMLFKIKLPMSAPKISI